MKAWIVPSLLLVCGCVPQRSSDLPYRSGTIERRPDGSIEWARLAEPALFDGVPCGDWVRLRADGSLHSCVLARDFVFGTRALPAHTTVFLEPAGVLHHCWLRHDQLLDGIPCEGGVLKSVTSFHPNGRLHFVFLNADHEIQGVPCEASAFHPVELDPEGRLRACQLARDLTRAGKTFSKGTLLRFEADGTPMAREREQGD